MLSFINIILIFLIKTVIAFDLIKNDYGHFITGNGCGTKTEIKLLMGDVPKEIENHPCTMIPFRNNNFDAPKDTSNARGKQHVHFSTNCCVRSWMPALTIHIPRIVLLFGFSLRSNFEMV